MLAVSPASLWACSVAAQAFFTIQTKNTLEHCVLLRRLHVVSACQIACIAVHRGSLLAALIADCSEPWLGMCGRKAAMRMPANNANHTG